MRLQIWLLALPWGIWNNEPNWSGFVGILLVSMLLLVSADGLPCAPCFAWEAAMHAHNLPALPCGPPPPRRRVMSWPSRWSSPSSSCPWTTLPTPTSETSTGKQAARGRRHPSHSAAATHRSRPVMPALPPAGGAFGHNPGCRICADADGVCTSVCRGVCRIQDEQRRIREATMQSHAEVAAGELVAPTKPLVAVLL